MPTRSYYFPNDFKHLEEILRAEPDGLSDEDAAYFRMRNIPPITSEGALPLFLGISTKTIFSIRNRPGKHYRSFPLRKKDGTDREISTPRTYLKVIQWWISDNILNKAEVAPNVFGFVAGRSAIQNAAYHLGAAHILNVDIQQFFPSIVIGQVQKIFEMLGFNHSVSAMLSEICCLNGSVPQGAPTSPALANLVLKDLDAELSDIALKAECRYSRYADDLTFSSMNHIEESLLKLVEVHVGGAGFSLKAAKTRFAGHGARMEVTGIVINEKLQPSRDWRKNTRARLHRLERAVRLTRHELQYLFGICGMANQFPSSSQMSALSNGARQIIERRSPGVIGHGENPILPASLTIRQAEALAKLSARRTNADIASSLGITESAVKKRLQEAFRKTGVNSRSEAERWAKKNL